MRVSTGHLLIGAFVVLSLAAVVGGFLIIGSPTKQRLLSLDKQRAVHLFQIATAVNRHWQTEEHLPASLDDISSEWGQQPRDPETGEPYRYEITGSDAFKLCAVFALEDNEPSQRLVDQRFATHGKGLHCYDLQTSNAGMPFGLTPWVLE